jgi:predicted metal-dependent HD superfamily phosphohydrolase
MPRVAISYHFHGLRHCMAIIADPSGWRAWRKESFNIRMMLWFWGRDASGW